MDDYDLNRSNPKNKSEGKKKMLTIILKNIIAAPIERCFDLSRSIDLHVNSMASSKEKAIAGRKSGLINLNETVTWKAKHFGINFTMTSKITAMEKPNCFTDEMIKGPFRKLHHQHLFKSVNSGTEMTDIFEFGAPLGALGKLAESIILKNYMKNLLVQRNNVIKKEAEIYK